MSETIIPLWYKDQWNDKAFIRYQNRGYVLKGTTEAPIRIQGKKFYFLGTGELEAQPYQKGDTISVLNPTDDTIEMESREWDAPYALYDWDGPEAHRMPVNEAAVRQEQAAKALGRRSDRIIYDAIMAASLPGDQIFGSYSTAFDPYTLMAGFEKLADNDVETADGGIFCPLPSKAFYQCQTYKVFANSDWTGGDLPLTRMVKHKTFDVGHCFILPPHLRRLYTGNTTEVRFRAWHKSAIGAGHNREMRTEWIREGLRKRWTVNHTIDGCAAVMQTKGIVEFRFKLDSPIEDEIQRTEAVA
jgi:hypothetical protein